MSVVLQTGIMYYRESQSDDWHPVIMKEATSGGDVDLSAFIEEYSQKSWLLGEYCRYFDSVYRCISPIIIPEAWTSAHWTLTNVSEELRHAFNCIAQPYNETSTYSEGQYCIHDGAVYLCISKITTPETWNTDHWSAQPIGNSYYNLSMSIAQPYNPAKIYKKGEMCMHWQTLHRCTIDMEQAEEWDADHWASVLSIADITGDGQLNSGFAATDLTGAANELKNDILDTGLSLNQKVSTSAVLNDLTATSAGFVLDARQGKALNDSKIGTSQIANNLTTTAEGYVLDARQGKALNDGKIATSKIANNLTTTTTGYVLDASRGKALNDAITNLNTKIDGYLDYADVSVTLGTTQYSSFYYVDAPLPSGVSVSDVVSVMVYYSESNRPAFITRAGSNYRVWGNVSGSAVTVRYFFT